MRILPQFTIVLAVLGSAAWAISIGPADEASGAPGDATCVVCHGDFALNAGPGAFSIEALAGSYGPADTIPLTVHLAQAGQSRWGFELTALDAAAQPVGQLILLDTLHTQYSAAVNGRQYVKHTLTGTYAATPNQAPGWTLAWVAPTSDAGPVTFHATGNAANGDGTSAGDYIYSTSTPLPSADPFPCCVGLTGNVDDDPLELVTLADITLLVNHVFVTFEPLPCPAEANTSGDPEGTLNLTDITRLINALYIAPFPATAPCR